LFVSFAGLIEAIGRIPWNHEGKPHTGFALLLEAIM
jgi:hypothetical protein